jgi:hypothetical protein
MAAPCGVPDCAQCSIASMTNQGSPFFDYLQTCNNCSSSIAAGASQAILPPDYTTIDATEGTKWR